MKALIVKHPFGTLIVEGKKKREYRKQKTKIRGRIGIIENGKLIGEVTLVDVEGPLKVDDIDDLTAEEKEFLREYSETVYAYVFEDAKKYNEPKKIKKKRGAVRWVNIEE